VLREALAPLDGKIAIVFVCGPAASGAERAFSSRTMRPSLNQPENRRRWHNFLGVNP